MVLRSYFCRKRRGTDSGSKAGTMNLKFFDWLKSRHTSNCEYRAGCPESTRRAPRGSSSSPRGLQHVRAPPARSGAGRGEGSAERPRLHVLSAGAAPARGCSSGSSGTAPTARYATKGGEKSDKAAAATPGPQEPPRRAGPRGHMAAAPGHAQQGRKSI